LGDRFRRYLAVRPRFGEVQESTLLGHSAFAPGMALPAPKATFRETAVPAWLEIDMRHARTMRAVARAGWI